jgi:hypothetical protein
VPRGGADPVRRAPGGGRGGRPRPAGADHTGWRCWTWPRRWRTCSRACPRAERAVPAELDEWAHRPTWRQCALSSNPGVLPGRCPHTKKA